MPFLSRSSKKSKEWNTNWRGNKLEANANIPGICPVSKNSWNTTGLETQYGCLCKLPLPNIYEMLWSTKCKSLLLIQIKSSLPGLREEMTDSVRPWEPNIENSIGKWSANQSTQINENWANIQRHWMEIKYKYQILGNVLADQWSFKNRSRDISRIRLRLSALIQHYLR